MSQIQSLWNELLVVNSCLSARPEITNASIQMFEVSVHKPKHNRIMNVVANAVLSQVFLQECDGIDNLIVVPSMQ